MRSTVPWWLEPSDLVEKGEPELQRDCRHETHIGLVVQGTINRDLTLGILAIRCIRGSARKYIPLGLAIADELIDLDTLQSNPNRRSTTQADGFGEKDDGA